MTKFPYFVVLAVAVVVVSCFAWDNWVVNSTMMILIWERTMSTRVPLLEERFFCGLPKRVTIVRSVEILEWL